MTKSVCGGSLGPSRRRHPNPPPPLAPQDERWGARSEAGCFDRLSANGQLVLHTSYLVFLMSYLLPLTSFSISIGATVPKPAEVVTRGAPEVRPCLSSSPPCPGGGAAAPARAGRASERFVRRPAARDCGVRRREPRRRDDEPGRRCSDSERAHCSTDAPAHAERHSVAASGPAAHA